MKETITITVASETGTLFTETFDEAYIYQTLAKDATASMLLDSLADRTRNALCEWVNRSQASRDAFDNTKEAHSYGYNLRFMRRRGVWRASIIGSALNAEAECPLEAAQKLSDIELRKELEDDTERA